MMTIDENSVQCDLLVIGGDMDFTHAAINTNNNGQLDAFLVDKGYVSMTEVSFFTNGLSALFNREPGHINNAWKGRILRMGEYT